MPSIPSLFGKDDASLFDKYEEFVPDHNPMSGRFLEGHDELARREHVAFHRLTRALFEERKVYDMRFNYNLARLNLDTRHKSAGYRYAVEDRSAEDAIDDERRRVFALLSIGAVSQYGSLAEHLDGCGGAGTMAGRPACD